MRTHRIHIEAPLEPGENLLIDGQPAHYLSRVLRLSSGQPLVLFNGDGHDYASELTAVSKGSVTASIQCRLPALKESPLRVIISQAVSRGERMDTTLQKCTELGAYEFRPLLSERVEVRLKADRIQRRMDHWRAVVVSACEQSGRARVPMVHSPEKLEDRLAAESQGLRLVLDPEAEQTLASVALNEPVELLVGPEGGFSEAELNRMKLAAVQAVNLGPRVLRTETAGPAALAVLQACGGDFR